MFNLEADHCDIACTDLVVLERALGNSVFHGTGIFQLQECRFGVSAAHHPCCRTPIIPVPMQVSFQLSCFHIIPFLSDLYPCEGLAFLLQSGSSFTISPFRWEQGSTEDTLFFYISACKIFFGVNQLLQISDLPVDSVLLPKKPLQRAVHDFKPIDITVIQKRPDLSDTNPRSAIFNDTIQALEPFAIVELELLRLRSLIRHKKPNPVIVKKCFPGNACYPADFPDGI